MTIDLMADRLFSSEIRVGEFLLLAVGCGGCGGAETPGS